MEKIIIYYKDETSEDDENVVEKPEKIGEVAVNHQNSKVILTQVNDIIVNHVLDEWKETNQYNFDLDDEDEEEEFEDEIDTVKSGLEDELDDLVSKVDLDRLAKFERQLYYHSSDIDEFIPDVENSGFWWECLVYLERVDE